MIRHFLVFPVGLAVVLFLHGSMVLAQVENDNIENRLELRINTPCSSSTTDCTLQWSCLDHIQTKKCIQYHNDQWFYFTVANENPHYINISNQECRDLRGVQILVIGGIPCEPDSYDILQCISLGNHDDIFVVLDSLKPGKEYLVLVDGYLHDFCSFQIELSSTPKGMPVDSESLTRIGVEMIADYHLELYWSIPDSLSSTFETYEVYRRHSSEFKSLMIHETPQGFNAHGEPRLDYVIEDILQDYGAFYYKIIGVGDAGRTLVANSLIQVPRPDTKGLEANDWIELELRYPNPCKLRISIYDAKNHSLLYWTNFNYDHQNRRFEHYIKEYKEDGITSFKIEVMNLESSKKNSYLRLK